MHVSHVCLRLSQLSMPDPSKVKHGHSVKLNSLGKTIYSLTGQRPFSKNFLAPLLVLAGLSVNFEYQDFAICLAWFGVMAGAILSICHSQLYSLSAATPLTSGPDPAHWENEVSLLLPAQRLEFLAGSLLLSSIA